MKKFNIVMIYSNDMSRILFCKRIKRPYKDKFNFPGGKVEVGESGEDAAYRELEEETGIAKNDILPLCHLIDFSYYNTNNMLELYVSKLIKDNVHLVPEKNPLEWVDVDGTDFGNDEFFGGDGNILHCVLMSERNKDYIFGRE